VAERLVMTRAHTAVLWRPIAWAVLASTCLAGVVGAVHELAHPGFLGVLLALVAGAGAAWAVLRLVRRVWEWDRTLLVVTSEHVAVYRRGLRRTEQIVPLAVISRLRVRRSIPGRLLGYGTIEVTGGGRGTRLRYVPDPDSVSSVISTYAGRRDLG
jgi:hypothetical protein